MELRQLRYFVKVAECGSLGRAATELGVVTSALSQQISRLESELSTRLLTRTSTGVVPTDAGLAFLRQAQLSLRHADDAMKAARESRLSGHVSIGLAQTTASVLALPFMRAMRERYPDVRLRLVESLSGHLSTMLNARQLDLAIVFHTETARRWSVMPLLDERLFLIAREDMPGLPPPGPVRLRDLSGLPLLLPSDSHGLRALVNNGFARLNARPNLAAEIDGLDVLMELVEAGLGATIPARRGHRAPARRRPGHAPDPRPPAGAQQSAGQPVRRRTVPGRPGGQGAAGPDRLGAGPCRGLAGRDPSQIVKRHCQGPSGGRLRRSL